MAQARPASAARTARSFRMKFKVVLHKEAVGGYSVEVPALPGCFSEGDTLEEALANIKEAIECYLDEPGPASLPPDASIMEVEV
jgi:predicted RNase H-like HicB family nuclease